ncbi:MAG: type VI secretion system-associated FHA domain protein [Nannocystaceae bacterium]
MPSLRITIVDHDRGESRQQRFGASPVRIGRDSGNELHLPFPFVSRWQAVVRFDRSGANLHDLGSANPLRLGGERIAREGVVPIHGVLTVTLGHLELRVELRADEDAPTLRAIGGPGDPDAPLAIDGELASDPSIARDGGGRPQAALRRLREPHEALTAARAAWTRALEHELRGFDDDEAGRAAKSLLRREVEAWGAPWGPSTAGTRASEGPSAISFAGELALHLMPRGPTPTTVEEARRLGDRIVRAIQALASSTVELQRVWASERAELGVADLSPSQAPLDVDADALLEALLDPRDLSDITPERVVEATAGLQEHVRALIRSSREAARQLAERLAPAAIAGGGQELWPGGARARWRRYCDHYRELCGDDGARIGGVFRALMVESYRRALDSGARWARQAGRAATGPAR